MPSRGVPFLVFGLAVGGPESRGALAGHLAHVSAELRPWTLPRRLPTFLLGDDVAEARVRAEYERLAAVKQRYDPENVFRFTHNVPPAA